MAVSPAEFAKRVKEKYPQYQDIDDVTLTKRMVEKYPEYKNQVSFEPTTLAGRASSMVRRAADPLIDVTTPFTNPAAAKLEDLGNLVSRSVEGASGNIAEKGFPATATATSMIGEMGALTPMNLAIGIGAEGLPIAAAPLARRANTLRSS